jgi:hypothetical protein
MYLPATMSLPILLLCFTVRKPGTTFQEYKAYYEQHHSKNIYGFLGDDSPATYSRHYVERPEDGNSSQIPAHGDPAFVSLTFYSLFNYVSTPSFNGSTVSGSR